MAKKTDKIEIAKSLIAIGMTIEQIVSIKGLESCELEEIVEEPPEK
ncbi:MAG: hypothetical protein HQM10_22865 [Candidatus Riflebacteria bacterium]|nr:hypothetical protein [Candidatus Riflebacteria bacterium]